MVICVCGKSGSGKSTISKAIMEKRTDSIHVDIDKIGHEALGAQDVILRLEETFGKEIFVSGVVDRKKLSKIVFSSEDEMDKLSMITWEFMEQKIDKIIRDNKGKIIILDWLLLPKTKYFSSSDLRVLMDVPYEIRKERILKRDRITAEQFELREQASFEYDVDSFDYIIYNNDEKQIKRLVKII